MIPLDFGGGNCRWIAPEELEATFFYPGPQDLARTPSAPAQERWDRAKEVCIECPIFIQCREASWGQEYGVWGGTDQHERHLHRRHVTKALALKSEAERTALAAFFHARHASGIGDSPDLMARQTGYSSLAIRLLLDEHEERLAAERQRRDAERPVPREAAVWKDVPKFPKGHPPKADAWAWVFGRAYAGHYVAQTADGAYLRMKVKPSRVQTTKWLPASHVDMRTTVIPVVQSWAGRPDGVQEIVQDDQRPEQQAADAA